MLKRSLSQRLSNKVEKRERIQKAGWWFRIPPLAWFLGFLALALAVLGWRFPVPAPLDSAVLPLAVVFGSGSVVALVAPIALRKVFDVPPHHSNIAVVWFVFVATALVLVGWSPLVSVGSALYGLVAAAVGGIYVVGFVFMLIVFKGGSPFITVFCGLVALSVLLLPFLLLLGWSGSLWFVIAAIVVFAVTIWMK
jgi:hypothetical protein